MKDAKKKINYYSNDFTVFLLILSRFVIANPHTCGKKGDICNREKNVQVAFL